MPVMVDSEGKYVTHTPASDVAAGEVVALNDLVGVAPVPISAGTNGHIAVRGIARFPKQPGISIAPGTRVFWDVTNGYVTNQLIVTPPEVLEFGEEPTAPVAELVTLSPFLGKTVEAAPKAALSVRVRLAQ
jgi:predicted RecA/RadA family phage recombinase